MRQRVLIDPNAPRERKPRNVEAERHQKETNHFYESHPLAQMYTCFQYLLWNREDCNWKMTAIYANRFCSAYANASDEDKAFFTEALPNPPSYLGEYSGFSWIAYLSSLIASKTRRERLANAVKHAIVETKGVEFLPPIYRSLASIDVTECPF